MHPIKKEEKVRVNARISQSLYDWICSEYDNTSQAIIEGLENLKNSRADASHTHDIHDIQEHTQLKLRLEDLKAQIENLLSQLNIKDIQIEKMNENMHKQAVHIQSLIQENSRLNMKLLPEKTDEKKTWWKFW